MRSIDYSTVESGVAAIAGIDPSNILAHEKILLAEYINDATRYCWDYYPWAEAVKVEKRNFREVFDRDQEYQVGDEVYSINKYYRMYDNQRRGTPPYDDPETDKLSWYELGDLNEDPEWSEEGFYKIGARIKYNDEVYLCYKDLGSAASTEILSVNFFYDGILPTNTTYFLKIDTSLQRFIAYEDPNQTTIGTIISVHRDDPKFASGKPLNWTEEEEGIFVELTDYTTNFVYIKYRPESPVYLHDGVGQKVPSFLVPAIKAYAYRSYLIGDGQHEKAQLQEIRGLDLLLREVDKFNHQQDRGQAFQISSEPYRRVSTRGQSPVTTTTDQIGGFKTATVTTSFKFTPQVSGKNAVKRNFVIVIGSILAQSTGKNIVKKGFVTIVTGIHSSGRGEQKVKRANANISYRIFTGTRNQSIGIGQVEGAVTLASFVMQVAMKFAALGVMSAWASRAKWNDVNVKWEDSK